MTNQAAATTSNALKVMVFTPSIRAFLEANDPKALEQAEEALAIEAVDEQLNEVFYNPSHEMNQVLRERFGVVDEDGFRLYSPTKAEMREQLEIINKGA